MIRAVIFDLDGTLVETEVLKAHAYAAVVGDLLGLGHPDPRAVNLYERIVGATDEAVCRAMTRELGLSESLQRTSGSDSWEALHHLRMTAYRERFGTQKALVSNSYRHNVELLKSQKAAGMRVAVATSSFTDEARRVLTALELLDLLDDVVGRDLVTMPKPDPEIYRLVLERLKCASEEALVIEDSPVGVWAAQAAGIAWVCVATEFSRRALANAHNIDPLWVAHEPSEAQRKVEKRMSEASRDDR